MSFCVSFVFFALFVYSSHHFEWLNNEFVDYLHLIRDLEMRRFICSAAAIDGPLANDSDENHDALHNVLMRTGGGASIGVHHLR